MGPAGCCCNFRSRFKAEVYVILLWSWCDDDGDDNDDDDDDDNDDDNDDENDDDNDNDDDDDDGEGVVEARGCRSKPFLPAGP